MPQEEDLSYVAGATQLAVILAPGDPVPPALAPQAADASYTRLPSGQCAKNITLVDAAGAPLEIATDAEVAAAIEQHLEDAPHLALGTTSGTAAEGTAPAAAVSAHNANNTAHPDINAAGSLTINVTGTVTKPWAPMSTVCPQNLLAEPHTGGTQQAIRYPGKWITAGTFTDDVNYPTITGIECPDLVGCTGNMFAAAMPALTTASFPALEYCGGTLCNGSMASLTTASFPALEYCGSTLCNGTMLSLTTASFPALKYCGSNLFCNYAMNALTTVSFPALKYCGDSLFVSQGMAPMIAKVLTTVSFPALKYCGSSLFSGASSTIYITALTTASFPALECCVGATFTNVSMDALTTVSLPALKKAYGDISFTLAQLSQASVDHLLAIYAAMDGTNGTLVYGPGRNINLGGSTSTASVANRTSNEVTATFNSHPYENGGSAWLAATGMPLALREVTPIKATHTGVTIARNGTTTATLTFGEAHQLSTGAYITIEGASNPAYNGAFVIASATPGGTTATMTMAVAATDSSGSCTVKDHRNRFKFAHAGSDGAVASLKCYCAPPSYTGTPLAVTTCTVSGTNLITVVTASPHGLVTGDVATLYGCSQAACNGTRAVTRIDDTTFTMAKTSLTNGAVTGCVVRTSANCGVGDSLAHVHTLVKRGVSVTYNLPA